jgi:hypothetical protein
MGILTHRPLDTLDATAALSKFIAQEHLMDVIARQAIGRREDDTFKGGHCYPIAQPVEPGPLKGSATIAVITVDMLVSHMPVGLSRDVGVQPAELLLNRLLLLLPGG